MKALGRLFRFGVQAIAALAIAACGGGGDGGSAPPVEPTINGWQAWVNLIGTPVSLPFTISGTVLGYSVSGSGTYTTSALSGTIFESSGALVQTATYDATIVVSGQSQPMTSSSNLYVDSNYRMLGVSNGGYGVVTNWAPLPQSLKAGDAGTIFVMTMYTDGTKQTLAGTATMTYEVRSDTASTALFVVTNTERDPTGAVAFVDISTFRVTTDGSVTYVSDVQQVGSEAITMTF